MEPTLTAPGDLQDDDNDAELRLHAWRTEQLWRLGLPHVIAEVFADRVDWHALAELIERGCAPELALEIVR